MFLVALPLYAALSGHAIATTPDSTIYKRVVAFSIDGLHGSDVEKEVAIRPGSTIAALLDIGFEYGDWTKQITSLFLSGSIW
jgi:hypothetical protein